MINIHSNFPKHSDTSTPSDDEIMSLSEDLLEDNKKSYEELAK
ncbi:MULTISPECIES: hypothetical protein [Aerococcus]|uniref:Uncharacterized protein n=1 Tax=Aerococcus mictus TaxID=2976810 RepID=A0A9Q4DE82_9LACT|nr:MULTISPECIES: hypothetical protein [Aerococcus]AEA00291.1 hypothetical protein HMPREF9243_0089 [Aerococcus sp. Group 1]MCY3031334.1 hypothetical protein [Aerococcus sp. Group 1]MCY3040195.1 hypothetical protein [Aerococcus sp. Group 2]MCY3041918.1 hypothetical protein [Aerococcus sp. Group 2]MCY3043588.1 hypothetical protein [Aerococcus sp. Group 2]